MGDKEQIFIEEFQLINGRKKCGKQEITMRILQLQ